MMTHPPESQPEHFEFLPDNHVTFINSKGAVYPICGGDMGDGYQPSTDDAIRIVACLNACQGIPTERLRPGIVHDVFDFCEAYTRYLAGSDSALCGMAKIARLVAGTPIIDLTKDAT